MFRRHYILRSLRMRTKREAGYILVPGGWMGARRRHCEKVTQRTKVHNSGDEFSEEGMAGEQCNMSFLDHHYHCNDTYAPI